METKPEQKLIAAIEEFLTSSGMKPTRFGKDALGDANLLKQLHDGRELRRASRDRIESFLKSNAAPKPRAKQQRKSSIPPKVQA